MMSSNFKIGLYKAIILTDGRTKNETTVNTYEHLH